jgi:hypothetical protein
MKLVSWLPVALAAEHRAIVGELGHSSVSDFADGDGKESG